ncbi:GNAT family N-acetyltransferase [Streptomyces sp. HUAS TT20]|uniref:GNAT family N-acetyltransferase n=1 Tax=Streptomyces sp. HUAS TT20 TaxID=3447509 RepID=UPI0021D97345|nr:GNAT family N-acetyltransferase [Streptomyces sp. HUAS 15-9]UXY29639.1 GNAT family N-acetyltransferase [Streptomyces sp. HUAS 15-9]
MRETEKTETTETPRTTEEPHVLLRPVTEDDLEVFLAYEHDPEAVRRSRFTPRPRDAFLKHWRERILGNPDGLVRAVTVDGEVAGNIVSWWEGEDRYVGYWLGRAYWARGIGTEALGAFLQEERIRPLYADPFSGNTASVRLLEKHGFEHAGTIRDGDDEYNLLVLDALSV